MSPVYYEVLGVEVLLPAALDGAFIAVCGVVDATEAAQFAVSDARGATWSHAKMDDGTDVLSLSLRGRGVFGVVELCFAIAPDEKLLQAVTLGERANVPLVFFTKLPLMKEWVKKFARQPTDEMLGRVFSKALYGDDFRVEPGALAHFLR